MELLNAYMMSFAVPLLAREPKVVQKELKQSTVVHDGPRNLGKVKLNSPS